MNRKMSILLAISVLLGFGSESWAGKSLDDVKTAGVLVVGVRDDVPPFGFIDERTGAIVGVDVDLAAAVARRLGVRMDTRSVTGSGWIQDLVNGNVDLVAATVTRTPDRAKVADFSAPYFMASQRIIARRGAVSSLSDLEGKRIGTSQGPSSEKNIKEAVPSASCIFYSDPAKAVEALRKGEVDALSASGANLYGCLSALPKDQYEISKSVRISEDGFRLAVRKGDSKLLEVVNSTLADLKEQGEAQKIFERWFRRSEPGKPETAPSGVLKATGLVSRGTSTPGRYLVLPIQGSFRPSMSVLVVDPQGHPIGSGKVTGLYEDEVYIDLADVPPGVVQPGFGVTMSHTPEEAQRFVVEHRDLAEKIKEETRVQAQLDQKEVARRAEEERKERARWQEEMERTKMTLDYQYNYYGYPFYR